MLGAASGLGFVVVIVAVIQVIVALAIYVWTALALGAVFRKAGEASWKAWVPLYNCLLYTSDAADE